MQSKIFKLGIIGPEKGPGQLGMLLAWEANKLHCNGELSFSLKTIGSEISPDWSDENFLLSEAEIEAFAKETDLITYETESISERFRNKFASKLQPSLQALDIFRNRYTEKNFFKSLKLAVPAFHHISDKEALSEVLEKIIKQPEKTFRLKTCELGYDGHGQEVIDKPEKLSFAWPYLDAVECILEEEINIERELSIIATRFADGQIIYFPIPQNIHQKGILYRSRFCKLSKRLETKLQKSIEKVLNKLNYIGTFALEVFELADGSLLVNEGAPRVHNSGHFTVNFCQNTNQFNAHIRAICGLSVVQPQFTYKFFSMTNLLGLKADKYEELKNKLQEFENDNEEENFKIYPYWYGKPEAFPGRKMGHINLISNSLKMLEKAEKFLDKQLN